MSGSLLPALTWQGTYIPETRTAYTTVNDDILKTVSEALDRLKDAWKAEKSQRLESMTARTDLTEFVTGSQLMDQKLDWLQRLAAQEVDGAYYIRMVKQHEERCREMAKLCAAEGMLAVVEHLEQLLIWIKSSDVSGQWRPETLDIVNKQIIWWIEGHGEDAMKEATLEKTRIVAVEIMRDFETMEPNDCQIRWHEAGSRVSSCSSCVLKVAVENVKARVAASSASVITAPAPAPAPSSGPSTQIPPRYLAVAPDLPRAQPAVLPPGLRYMCNIGNCTNVFQRKSDVRIKHMPTKHNIHGWGYGPNDYDTLGPFTSAECQALRPNQTLTQWKEEQDDDDE